eukprot:9503766-Pyramimonas_sp.AAC.2
MAERSSRGSTRPSSKAPAQQSPARGAGCQNRHLKSPGRPEPAKNDGPMRPPAQCSHEPIPTKLSQRHFQSHGCCPRRQHKHA